jgi:vitamin B12 transporter
MEKSDFTTDEIGTTWGTKVFEGTHKNLELKDDFDYDTNSFLVVGIGSSSDEAEYKKTDNTKKDKTNKDNYIYLTNSNKIDNTILTQSIRYDGYDNFDKKTTGKIGIKHNIDNQLSIGANYGTAYNVPNIIQELNPWGAENDKLNPEDSTSYDISIGYKALKVTYFHSEVKDLIDWYDPTPANYSNNDAIYKNLDGKNTLKGIELSCIKEIMSDTILSLNYATLNAKDKNGKDLARRAKSTFRFGIDYYGISKLHINLTGNYTGKRYDDALQTKQTGRYTVFNAVVNYDISSALTTYIKIDNLTDKYYQSVDGYATSPRAYYAGMEYKF